MHLPRTLRSAVLLLCFGLAMACAGTPAKRDETTYAELAFAQPGSPGGLPGRFTRLDGKRLPDYPGVLRVPAGTHTIEYNCPDTITMDAYPSVKANFEPGRRYLLECTSNGPGRIVER